MKISRIRFYFSIASFLVPLLVYLITLAPGLYFIDTGELATVCIKLGIAHPTGYPLFTIIGNVFTKLPFGDYIYELNFMCAVMSSLTVMMFFNLMYFILTGLNLEKKENIDFITLPEDNQFVLMVISFVSSLVLAFSRTFWNTSNSLEVYSLHALLITAVIYTFLYSCNEIVNNRLPDSRYWISFGFILGLSFTNHLSTIFLSVGTLFLYFSVNGFSKKSFLRILLIAVPFSFALTVYIYFFMRGDNNVIAWGNPVNFENFIRHVSGKQFSIWMFSSTDSASKQFAHFINIYPKEFIYLPLIVAIPGLIFIYIKQRKLFYYTVLLFVFNILYAINYDIHDIDTYFLLSFIVTSIWFGTGLYYLYKKFKLNTIGLIILSMIIIAFSIYGNFEENNLRNSNFVKEYTQNVFKSTKGKSIVFSTQWDFWVSASFYFQYVFNERPDVIVLDKELMRKSWYLKHIRDHFPELYERSKNLFELYEVELRKFEKFTNRYTNPQNETDRQNLLKIQDAFMNLLNSIVKNNSDYNIYSTFEIEDVKNERITPEYFRIPEGLLLRYSASNTYDSTFAEPEIEFTKTNQKDYYHEFLMRAYYMAFLNRASFLMNFNKLDLAENYIKRALDILNNDRTALNLLKKVNELKLIQK